jgi:AraC family transcriptional regulator
MELFIRNMVCQRCIKTVNTILQQAGVMVQSIELGKVIIDAIAPGILNKVKANLEKEGFELLDDHKMQLVNEIKKQVVQLVHYSELDEFKTTLSAHLSGKLHKDAGTLSNLFSSIENTTIEQYFILQKTEKVKELLVYDELTLSEIAWKMGYSSVAHLSAQFKKITGFTPTVFKKLKDHHRKPLDKI